MFYCIVTDGSYVVGTASSETPLADGITEEEKNNIFTILCNKPSAPSGYTYKFRADNLEWELVELPPEPDPGEDEATAEDYEQALADLGVRV